MLVSPPSYPAYPMLDEESILSSSHTHVTAALVAASQSLSAMKADARNDHFKSEYISLSAITERAKAALKAHNITIVHTTRLSSSGQPGTVPWITVRTIALHDSGETATVETPLAIANATPQGVAGAITYGRRIGIAQLLSIVIDEDDDGNMASGLRDATTSRIPQSTQSGSLRPTTSVPVGASVMPFGSTKGTPLYKLPMKELVSALGWAEKNNKFIEWQDECRAEIARREAGDSENTAQ